MNFMFYQIGKHFQVKLLGRKYFLFPTKKEEKYFVFPIKKEERNCYQTTTGILLKNIQN